ncbi:hypothetical protein BDN71DRAFT_1508289 [Pleurotus eryngii]|uniref:Uncharacterized protein n=1 Tax=Pleurotus eryngii TaxID=5323 RepID=A0A9P5ZWV0_PLEER|nr:hypothetical protein BDN71DRAFT_1508289 [Pleurotus eryngii]
MSASHRHSATTDVLMPSQSTTPVDVSMTSQSVTPIMVSPLIMPTDSAMPFIPTPSQALSYMPPFHNLDFNRFNAVDIFYAKANNVFQYNTMLSMGHIEAPSSVGHNDNGYITAGDMSGLFTPELSNDVDSPNSSSTNNYNAASVTNHGVGPCPDHQSNRAASDLALFGSIIDANFTFDATFNSMPLQDTPSMAARYLFSELSGITSEWPAPLAAPRPRHPIPPALSHHLRTTEKEPAKVLGMKRQHPALNTTPSKRKRVAYGQTSITPEPTTPQPTPPPSLPMLAEPCVATPPPVFTSSLDILALVAAPPATSATAPSTTPPAAPAAPASAGPPPAASLPHEEAPSTSTTKPKRGSRANGAKPKQTETLTSLRSQLATLKKAYNEAQSADLALSMSFAQVLECETSLRLLLSAREKELADLWGQVINRDGSERELATWRQKYDEACSQYEELQAKQSQYTASISQLQQQIDQLQDDAQGSLEEITLLCGRLSSNEESGRDDAEAAEVQYCELKERYEGQLKELSQALNTIHCHQDTINRLTADLRESQHGHEKDSSESSSAYSELRQRFESLENDSVRDATAHKEVVQELHARIGSLEHAYEKLGEDARSQLQGLKDDYGVQLLALRELEGQRDLAEQLATLQGKHDKNTEAHRQLVGELWARIVELEHAYQKLGEDARAPYQALKDDYEARLIVLQEQGAHRQEDIGRAEDLEEQLATLKTKYDKDIQDVQMQLEGLQQIQQHATEDAQTRHRQLQQEVENARQREAEAVHSQGIHRQVAADLETRLAASQEDQARTAQEAEDRLQAAIHEHALRVRELQREAQEALRQQSEASEARYQEMVADSQRPAEMQAAISTAIADARREAEVQANVREAGIQVENNNLCMEMGNLRTRVEQLQKTQNASCAHIQVNQGGQQDVLNVHPYAHRPVVMPMSTPRSTGSRLPMSNVRSTTSRLQTPVPSRNTSPGPSCTRPIISSMPRPAPYPTHPRIIAPSTANRLAAPPATCSHTHYSSVSSSCEATPANQDATPTPTNPGVEQEQQNPPPADAPQPPPTNGTSAAEALLAEVQELVARVAVQLSQAHTVPNQSKPPSCSRVAGVFSQQHEPKPRDPARIRMMNLIRNKLRDMLHIQHDSDIDAAIQQYGLAANPSDITDYEEDQNASPELHPFRPLWNRINHPWNLELAALFSMEFCAEHPEFTWSDIKEHFMTRLKVLHTNVTRNTTHPDGDHSIRQVLYDNHMKIIEGNMQAGKSAAWVLLYDMVKGLGLLGMSTDESDPEDNMSVMVIQKDWQAAEVIKLLQAIDRHHIALNCYGNSRSSTQPRVQQRHMGGPVSSQKAVAGLPINWYNPIWYASLSDFQVDVLGAVDEVLLPIINDDN